MENGVHRFAAAALAAQVADVLRREIVNGTFLPRARLPSDSDVQQRFDASRNTVRNGLSLLVGGGLISSSQGLGYEVRSREVFKLNASKFENLEFPQNGDAYSTDVINVGRRRHQRFRVEMLPASEEVADRLRIAAGVRRPYCGSVIAMWTTFRGRPRRPTIRRSRSTSRRGRPNQET